MSSILNALTRLATPNRKKVNERYFKSGPGEYGFGDRYLGVDVPGVRKIAAQFQHLSLAHVIRSLRSPYHEERLVALVMLTERFKRGDLKARAEIYSQYLKHIHKYVNNWDLVDSSAGVIVGIAWLNPTLKHRSDLKRLTRSASLWERRVSVVATQAWIRDGAIKRTFSHLKNFLNDEEDLIHKASGWMLREAGKKDVTLLRKFLNQYAKKMPRTMLRYSLEKLTIDERKKYMKR